MFRVKVLLLSLLMPAMVGVIVFLTAGRVDLPGVWAVLGVLTVFCLVMAACAERDLIRERTTPGQGERDRVTRPVGTALLLAHWVLAGLDARFEWSRIPLEVQIAGAVGYAVTMVFLFWTVRTNRFYSSAVRVQTDRGHRVVDGGPYRFVRHPGYAATLAGVFAGGLALGSWLALVPLVVCAGLFVRRILIEEDMLRRELPGYAEYAERVRSRLIAGVF
jgi:protein-S-isoprenylcysteine O-methyltransferase Ste14